MENTSIQDLDLFESVNLRKLVDLFWKFSWLVLLGLFLGAGLGYLLSRYQTPIYEAKTQVMVTRSNTAGAVADVTQSLNAQQLAQTYVELLSQQWVRNQVASQVGGKVDKEQINISAAANTMVINIAVEDADPARATRIADTLVQVLIAQNNTIQSGRYTEAEQGFDRQVEVIRSHIAEVQGKLNLVQTNASEQQKVELQQEINDATTEVDALRAKIDKYQGYAITPVGTKLQEIQTRLAELQAQLEVEETQHLQLKDQLTASTTGGQDTTILTALQSQVVDKEISINKIREEIASLQAETDFLTPFIVEGSIQKAITEMLESLKERETLLASSQQAYADLLDNGESSLPASGTAAELETDLAMYQEIYINLVNKREEVRLQKMQNMPNVIQVNPALAGDLPVRPRLLRNTGLGAAAGLILAVCLVFLIDTLDNTLKTREEIESTLRIPILGYIARINRDELKKDGFYTFNVPRSPVTEAFRSLRTNLEYLGVDRPLKSLLVSSPSASEGKTTVAANLAAVIAQSGKKVVIVDADLRRPRLHDEIGIPNRIGLSTVFRSNVPLEAVIQKWGDTSLSVITGGSIPPNPAELLGSEKMVQILNQLETQFDLVIIDSPPTIVTDSQLIAARTDGVLLVLVPGKSIADLGRVAVEQYRRVGARLLGAVLNNIQSGQRYGGYGYYSSKDRYYQYNDQAEDTDKPVEQKATKERKPTPAPAPQGD